MSGTALWSTVSDIRIKEGIEEARYDRCIEEIGRIGLYRYRYKEGMNDMNKDRVQLGYIAQEVMEVLPKAVEEGEGGIMSIDIAQINYTLYGAVKGLMERYKERKGRMEILERKAGFGGD